MITPFQGATADDVWQQRGPGVSKAGRSRHSRRQGWADQGNPSCCHLDNRPASALGGVEATSLEPRVGSR